MMYRTVIAFFDEILFFWLIAYLIISVIESMNFPGKNLKVEWLTGNIEGQNSQHGTKFDRN